MAQTVKHLSTMRETQVWSLGWEDPLEKEMAIHSSTIAWKIPWTEEPGRLQSMGSQGVGHNWVTSLRSSKQHRAKANRILPRGRTGHSKHPHPTTQEKTLHMDITRWSTLKSDWLYSLQPKIEKLYTVSKNKTGSWLVAQIMNSLLPNSDFNWRKKGKPPDHSGMN